MRCSSSIQHIWHSDAGCTCKVVSFQAKCAFHTLVQVGGRSTVSPSITQIIEMRNSEDERFARLLEILGQYNEEGKKTLVFVNSQEKCSSLFQQLLNYGYPNQMLHGDMQQVCLIVPSSHCPAYCMRLHLP
jgi:superfamily II DNA/RNA helicase